MVAVAAFSLSRFNSLLLPPSHASSAYIPLQFRMACIKFQNSSTSCFSSAYKLSNRRILRLTIVCVAAEESGTATVEEETSPSPAAGVSDQTACIAVSPSDLLTMHCQAEGTMTDWYTCGYQRIGVEGVLDLKVSILEGIASVELTKQRTVQATGVASNLLETMQGSRFKLQTLTLSFQDEEDFA